MAGRTGTAITLNGGAATWTNMPAAQAEFLGGTAYRLRVNLADFDQCRLVARVTAAGTAGAVLAVQYSTDESSWATLGNTVSIAATGTLAAAWAAIPAGARGDVYLRLGGQGGNGTVDPAFGVIALQVYASTSFERAGLVEQVVRNIYGLIRDMRDNAAGYKSAVSGGVPVATVAATMAADAGQYLLRIGWITDAFTRNSALMDAALGDAGLTVAQATALRDTLSGVANHTGAASLTTTNEINAESDYILANVPTYERLW